MSFVLVLKTVELNLWLQVVTVSLTNGIKVYINGQPVQATGVDPTSPQNEQRALGENILRKVAPLGLQAINSFGCLQVIPEFIL